LDVTFPQQMEPLILSGNPAKKPFLLMCRETGTSFKQTNNRKLARKNIPQQIVANLTAISRNCFRY
jgi:hypothetical protein